VDDHEDHDEPAEEDLDGEIVITIDPREGELDALGITREEFEAALASTLDAYDRAMESTDDPDQVGALDDAEIILGGKTYPLSAVADINITSDLDLSQDDHGDHDVEIGPE
jgi:hypothetical protein